MRSTWTSPAASWRRIVIGLSLTLVALAMPVGVAYAQAAAPPQAPAAAPTQPAPAPSRVFSGDVGILFNVVKPDKTADFEMVVNKLKEAMAKSDKPGRKEQAAGWRVLKQAEPLPGGNVLYVFLIDPVVKDADYTVSKILAEVFPTEVQELFKVYSASFAGGVSMSNYQLVAHLGK